MKPWKATLVGLLLAVLVHFSFEELTWPGLFYAGFPGMAAELSITGGHGGTSTQEQIAPILEIIVNTIIYAGLLWGLMILIGRFRSSNNPDWVVGYLV